MVTMPNKILVLLTGPGTCDTPPPKKNVNVTKCTWKKNSPKIAENSIIFEFRLATGGHLTSMTFR